MQNVSFWGKQNVMWSCDRPSPLLTRDTDSPELIQSPEGHTVALSPCTAPRVLGIVLCVSAHLGFLESRLGSSLRWAFLCSAGQGGVTTKSDFPNVSPCSTVTRSDLLPKLSLSQSPPFSDGEILKPISWSRCPD